MWLVATEDEVSEAVARKLLVDAGADPNSADFTRRNGYGYLKNKIDAFCSIRNRPILVMTDLDRGDCAPNLRRRWLGGRSAPGNLIFRIAVREVESWLIADRTGLAKYFQVAATKIECDPERITDPKRYLVHLARRAPRAIREDLLPPRGSIATQGFGYNTRVCEFVSGHWSAERAANASNSLERARLRIRQCSESFPSLNLGRR